jgi:hypothetical protein
VDKNANYSDVGIYCFFLPCIMQQQIETIVLVALPKESKPSGVIVTVLTFLMAKKLLVLKLYLQSKICKDKWKQSCLMSHCPRNPSQVMFLSLLWPF